MASTPLKRLSPYLIGFATGGVCAVPITSLYRRMFYVTGDSMKPTLNPNWNRNADSDCFKEYEQFIDSVASRFKRLWSSDLLRPTISFAEDFVIYCASLYYLHLKRMFRLKGEWILVTPLKRTESINLGDVIVFGDPQKNNGPISECFVKRVVGVAGQTIKTRKYDELTISPDCYWVESDNEPSPGVIFIDSNFFEEFSMASPVVVVEDESSSTPERDVSPLDSHLSVRVGSRSSPLAMAQTVEVVQLIRNYVPALRWHIINMTTTGDKILNKPLPKIGQKSLFTAELEQALRERRIDFVVHSLKDLPTTLPEGMCIAAVLPREDARDAIILHPKHVSSGRRSLESLPDGAVLGTSSVRRCAQLSRSFPHLTFRSIRGNLNTRLSKLVDHDDYDGICLAVAGIRRMNWADQITQLLDPDRHCMYAVGQGALALECTTDDLHTRCMLQRLTHYPTLLCCLAERQLLFALNGGCSAPVAVRSNWIGPDDEGNFRIEMRAGVFSLNGDTGLFAEDSAILKPVVPFECTVKPTPELLADRSAEGQTETVLPKDLSTTHQIRLGIATPVTTSVYRAPFAADALDEAISLGQRLFVALRHAGALEVIRVAKEQIATS